MIKLRLALILLYVMVLAGCGSEPPTIGRLTDFADVCDAANDGQRVAVEGYFFFPDSFTEGESVVLRLRESLDITSTPIGVQIGFGSAPNQLEEVATQYTDEDLKVYLVDGSAAGFGTRVRVSGKVYFPLIGQVFACGLANPLVERAE